MEEIRTSGDRSIAGGDETGLERSEPAIRTELRPRGRSHGRARWLIQFGLGALIVGGLVFGIGKRAEVASAITLAQARQEMERGQSFLAARHLEKLRREGADSREVQVVLLEAHYRAGEPERARELANRLVLTEAETERIQPLARKMETVGDLLVQARDMIIQQQWAEAVPLVQKASRELPDCPLPYVMLAQAHGGLYFSRQKPENLQACLAAQRRLEEIDPRTAEEVKKRLGPIEVLPQVIKHTQAADAALKAGRTEAAVPELSAADKLYPNSAMVHGLRAIMHAQRFAKTGKPEEKRLALEEYRTAVLLNPARASLRPRLGKLAKEVSAD